ncbi:MAG: pyridoxal phosphate-dependent aminotransferase [Chloroflexi bacterium]|nr:pyridoxal phosphate-dependent aminotransferase [Chloroflexota bacterium]MCY3582440.1 pyridoxal phosphate-dependent aminotransferase [Chloroflexota bacterium]MCY3716996.1 pyridoxal phosphate-dependent aminotransferase [Chloroflexota bacterium]MDE2652082.1 pyridoxal phosphate-dependent aminotransferase [Chloroflexota bacterium]MXV93291.1 pyridoxal phosphate-dependent aminotransferase [Chloroflexota bacterium]
MPSPTQLAKRIGKSPTIAMNDKAKQLAAEGHAVIGLAGGEPDFDTPAHIVEAAIKAMRDGETRYAAPSKGIRPLLEAIADKMQRENQARVDPNSGIIVTPGGKLALFLALKAMLDPGDEVLFPAPYWVSYPPIVTMVGGAPVPIETSSADGYQLHIEQLRERISPRSKAIIVNSPCNPTGHMLSSQELEAIASLALEHDLYIISDEIYEKLNFDGRPAVSLASIPEISERVVVINGMSKAYAMTGWRLGWLAGPSALINVAGMFNSQTATSAATFTQHAAVAALTGPQDCVEVMRRAYQERRDYMVDAFNSIPNMSSPPIEGAFYAFPKVDETSKSSEEVANIILEEAVVVGVPGSAFGLTRDAHIRFSFADDMNKLREAVERIRGIAHLLA